MVDFCSDYFLLAFAPTIIYLAPTIGFEPMTQRLTAACSTTELRRRNCLSFQAVINFVFLCFGVDTFCRQNRIRTCNQFSKPYVQDFHCLVLVSNRAYTAFTIPPSDYLYLGRDSNSQAIKPRFLRPLCLPIPPPRHFSQHVKEHLILIMV